MTEQWQELKETIIELRDNDGTGTQQEVCKFLVNYMDVLEEQMQPCEDAVRREAVDELSKALVHTTRDKADFLCNFWEGLSKLPSVTPQMKTGHWIKVTNDRGGHECDVCHDYAPSYRSSDEHLTKYCPNCGCRMVEPQESEK